MPEELTQPNEEEVSLEAFNEPATPAVEPKPNPEPGNKAGEENQESQKAKEPKPAEKAKETAADAQDVYASLDSIEVEGGKLDADTLKSFKEIAKENNLSPEAAKKIVDLQTGLFKKQQDDFKALQKSWEDASKVVYGDNLKNVETNCSRVLAELDKDGKFKELLALAGATKHPATLGFLKAVGDKLLEKPAVNPNATVSGNEEEPELEDFN